jgi:ABC-type antimicrobial peptide transport system ATPase subunit
MCDILDLILHEISPRQRDDLLDNLKVKAFIYYPPEMELENSTEYNKKLAEHKKGKHKGRYQKHLEWQDNEVLNPFHHYIILCHLTCFVSFVKLNYQY